MFIFVSTIIAAFDTLDSIGVQSVMAEMERLQLRGEVPEEELKALEMDMTGKVGAYLLTSLLFDVHGCRQIMLASWRGTRFEVMQALREVCDKVLKDHSVSENTLLLRAKVSALRFFSVRVLCLHFVRP